jgi:hypothetical protein
VRRLDCHGTSNRNADQTLGLRWRNFKFERNESQFRRVQENGGKHFDATKTEAGMRTIPMGDSGSIRCMFEGRPGALVVASGGIGAALISARV